MIENSFNITSLRFHLLDHDTFIVQGWFRKNNIDNNTIEMYLDNDPINVEVAVYTDAEIRRKYLGIDFSVDTEYSFSVKLPENYTKYKELYIYTVKNDDKRLTISISTSDLHDLQENIPSCIDSSLYDKKSKTLTVKGWAVSREPVTLGVTTLKGEEVNSESSFHERGDVVANYKETPIDISCGFEIKAITDPNTKLIIHIKNKYKETIHMVTAVTPEEPPKEKL
ncbi:MAG TPA: hypothetical protein IAC41_07115, partial [Candidatus Merdenecus merdavium]|nr:hypothetical protein [Candidatus Merdenecus merdavium]